MIYYYMCEVQMSEETPYDKVADSGASMCGGRETFGNVGTAVARRSCTSWREARSSLLMFSIMCTGTRMVRAWSEIARVTAWRIHHVA